MQQTPQNLWIPLLIGGTILTGLVGSFFFSPIMVWGGIMVAMFAAMMLGHPQQVLFMFWLWAAFRPLIMQMANHTIFRASNGIFAVAVIGICVALYAWRRIDTRGTVGIQRIFTALLGVTLVSFLLNRSPIVSTTWFFMNYLVFPFVFYVAYTTLDRRHWRYLFGAMIGLTLIQFALNIGWRLGVNPLPNVWSGTSNIYDMAQGTFGGCAHVAYFMVMILFLLFSALRMRTKYRPWIILLIGVVMLQFYITYTNHAYIYFIVLLPIYLVISKQSMRVRMACIAMVILGAMVFSLLSAWDDSTGTAEASVGAQFDLENLEYRWDQFTHGSKIELIKRIAVENATRDPFLWLLGNGPGNGLSAVGMKHSDSFAWEYLGEYVANMASYRSSQMTSISGSFYSGILSIWSELGAVGYLLYLCLYVYVVWRVAWQLIKDQYRDVFQRVLAEGFVMAMLTFILASLLQDIFWLLYFTVGLWIWAAMVWTPVEELQRSEDGRQTSEQGDGTGGQRSEIGSQMSGDGKGGQMSGGESLPTPAANRWSRPFSLK